MFRSLGARSDDATFNLWYRDDLGAMSRRLFERKRFAELLGGPGCSRCGVTRTCRSRRSS